MNFRRDIWSILLVTLVTALIWIWAAGETRDRKGPISAVIQFTVPDPENWVVRPDQHSITIYIEGPQLSLQSAQSLVQAPLEVGLSATTGRHSIDLLDRLRRHDSLIGTGVSLLEVSPRFVEVELDHIERFPVAVRPNLPGVQTEVETQVEPREVMVAMPSQVRQRLGSNFMLEAQIERPELDGLPPGVPHTREVKVRLPDGLAANGITISPARVKLTFTIRSRTREIRLPTVRIQLAGPPEDRQMYTVEIEPRQLDNVTITADADLVRRIEANEVPVVAVLHVGSREKELRIESKRITYFLALVPEPNGGTRGVQVTGRVNDSPELPVIQLRISER